LAPTSITLAMENAAILLGTYVSSSRENSNPFRDVRPGCATFRCDMTHLATLL
jgi:hypothetical protein